MDRSSRSGYFKPFAVLFMLVAAAYLFPPAAWGAPSDKLDKKILEIGPNEEITVIVRLKGGPVMLEDSFKGLSRGERKKSVVMFMKDSAEYARKGVEGIIKEKKEKGLVKDHTDLWVINGMSMTATRKVLEELAVNPAVDRIYPVRTIQFSAEPSVAAPLGASNMPNLTIVGAPSAWALGFTGQGVVVASLDSGVDYTHPALAASYRGGGNSWFDPYGQHVTPFDKMGHGTETTGVMVGKTPDGTVYGVAPGAKWIAAKIFNDSGSASDVGIHAANQWVLDPDGDPLTDDAPDIVNNSWGGSVSGTCEEEFKADIEAFRAAGILPVFSAGNDGPWLGTSCSPANNAPAFSVGSTDINDTMSIFSSKGPSACDGSVFPDISAPGSQIYAPDLNATYSYVDGTSFSAPCVSGAAAVLLSAVRTLSVDQLEATLTSSAKDLGPAGPDNGFGNGRLDIPAALKSFVPVNVSVSALTGAEGAAQQIDATWSSMAGAGHLKLLMLQLGNGNLLKVKYDHSTGLLYMMDDAGISWVGGFAPGSANLITGKNGILDCSKTAVTPAGDNLTVSFNLTPQPGYFGQQPIFMNAYDDLMVQSAAWQNKGTWTIYPLKPVNVSVSAPAGREGVPQQVTARWAHGGGAGKLRVLLLQVGTAATGGILKLKYDRAKNLLYVMNDAGSAWVGGFAPGSANLIPNSKGTLDCSKTVVTPAGNELDVSFNILPVVGYNGKKPTYLFAYDTTLATTPAWTLTATWYIKSTPPVNLSAAAPASNTGSPALVTAAWRDINGAPDLATVYLQVGNASTGGVTIIRYNRAANKLYMLNNAGTGWVGGFAPGSANTIAGQFCTLNCAATTVSGVGTDLTAVFSVTPAAGYTGVKRLYMYALDKDSNHPPAWEFKGTWNILIP